MPRGSMILQVDARDQDTEVIKRLNIAYRLTLEVRKISSVLMP